MILRLMSKRRSIRRFKPEQLPDEIFLKLVEAAITAPSAGNKQPWRFLVVKSKEIIESAAHAVDEERLRLADILRQEFRADYENYSQNFTIFCNAPALIVPIYRTFPGLSQALGEKAGADDKLFLSSLEHRSTLVSVSLSIQNILLMAQELGIGACCTTGPLIAENKLADCFKIPEGWQIIAVIAVGYPDEQPENPGRKPLNSVIKWLR